MNMTPESVAKSTRARRVAGAVGIAAIGIVIAYSLLGCGGGDESASTSTQTPIVDQTPEPTATFAPAPTQASTPYTNPATGASCDNVMHAQDAAELGANPMLLTLPLEPCAKMTSPPQFAAYSGGERALFFVEKGTEIVSPIDGVLGSREVSAGGALYGGGHIFVITSSDKKFRALLYIWQGQTDDSLLGQDIKRGDAIGTVGDPLPQASTASGASLALALELGNPATTYAPISDLATYWAGGQQNYYVR